MKPKTIVTTCLILFVSFSCAAQQSEYSFMDKNYFNYHRVQITSEGGYSPAFKGEIAKESYLYFTFAGYAFENRINVYNFRDQSSISLTVPIGFRINVSDEAGDGMMATPNTGIYVDFNYGKNSTYNNISDRGIQLSFGTDINYTIGAENYEYRNVLNPLTFSPMIRIGTESTYDFALRQDIHLLFKFGIPYKITNSDGVSKWANLFGGLAFNFPATKR